MYDCVFIKGNCYRWITCECVYQPSRDLKICAKNVDYLKFLVKVDCRSCECNNS